MTKPKPLKITEHTAHIFLAESESGWLKAQRIGGLVYIDTCHAGGRVALAAEDAGRLADWLRSAGQEDSEVA